MGHTFTKTIKCACKKCNESWMGDIEESAMPILTPIMSGHPIQIDYDNQTKLAEWLTLKFLVADCDRDTTPIASKKMLTAFMKNREIPGGLKIWIAHHNSFEWSAGVWALGLTMSFTPKKPSGRLRNNVKTFAFGVGHLFSLTFLSLLDGIDLEIDNPLTPNLWPSNFSTIGWPTPLVSHNDLGTLANIIEGLESRPDVTWGP